MSFDFLNKPIERGHYEPEGIFLSAPFEGRRRITQLWGENPGYYQRFQMGGRPLSGHNGLDFGMPEHTRLLATDKARVIEIANDPTGYGLFIKLQHWWGESLYAHLQGFAVDAGQTVPRGGLIGFSNNTGSSSGPHLHFAIRTYPYNRLDGWGGFTNPLPFFNPLDILLPDRQRF
ncbi:MAG: M23 family metallopeptidase [Caldilineaceae bacterium]|nr:M23 family metallopeptidase [Caldilineaceae bacterium]